MIPLQSVRGVLTWFSLHASDGATAFMCATKASSTYVWKFMSVDLESSLYAFLTCLLAFDLCHKIIILFLAREKVRVMFEHLSDIYNSVKDESFFRHLARLNNRCEGLRGFYETYVIGCTLFVLAMYPISMLYCWMNDNFNTECLPHAINFVLPWNQHTIVGYLGEICAMLIYGVLFLLSNGAILWFFVSICLQYGAFYKTIRSLSLRLNNPNENSGDVENICRLIQFHVSIKDWFMETSNILSPFIMVHTICCVLSVAVSILAMHLEFEHLDFEFFSVFTVNILSISNLFLYCYFGKLATESFEKMPDCLYEINWPDLSVKNKKYLILIIANMQRPIYYHGFGVVRLDLETFCRLMNTVMSYYMMFKTLISR